MKAKLLVNHSGNIALDSGSKKRLSSYLSRIRRDEERVLFDDRVVEVALQYAKDPRQVRTILGELSRCKSEDGLPFARSVGRYSTMTAIWENFVKPEKPDFRWNKRVQRAIRKVAKRYAEARLKPLTLPKTVEEAKGLLSDWSTSGGWESILTGKQYKRDILDEEYVEGLVDIMLKALEEGRFNYPILPGFRTQCVEVIQGILCKHKKRPVNMVTLCVVLFESLFANPLNTFLTYYQYSAIGKDDRYDIPQFIFGQVATGKSWVSLDYSAYDSTIPSWMLDAAFSILKGAFYGMTQEQAALWDVLVNTFIVKDIVTPDGVLHVTHGNPSGSKFTAIINGVVNEIMTEYWLDLFGWEGEYMIMGDDNLIFIQLGRPITEEEKKRIADVLTAKFGIKVNEDKTETGTFRDEPHFLSRWWNEHGAWRPDRELISLLAYPERYRDYKRSVLTPELIIYSYILGCERGMREWFEVDKFLFEHPTLQAIPTSKEVLRELPYTIRVRVELEVAGLAPQRLTKRVFEDAA